MSESQERMCAIVEPAKVDAFLAVCRKWDVLATVIGEVTEGDRLTVDWHGERIVDVPPRTVAHEGPVYERPMARPRRPRRPAGRRRGRASPRPGHRRGAPGALAGGRQQPGRRRQDLGHRAVRPLRPRQHRARPARGRRRRPHRRGHPPRHRAGAGRQRPLRPARPVRRRAAEPRRGLPQRRRLRRDAAGRHQLPELRLPGGARGDVAVRRGRPRSGRRLPRARPAGHRRQRQPLQPDRRRRRSTRRRSSACWACTRTSAAGSPAAGGRTARRCCCSARRGPSSAARPGRASCTATSAGGRRRSTWPPSARWGSCSRRSAGRPGQLRARPRRRRAGPGPRRVGAALRRRRAAAPGRRPVHGAVQRVRRARRRHDGGPGRRPGRRRGGRRARSPNWGRRAATASRVDGLLELAARRAAGRLVGHAAGAVRRRPRPRSAPFRRAPSRPADAGTASRPRSCAPSWSRCGPGWPGRPSSRRARCVGRRGEDHRPVAGPARARPLGGAAGARRTSPSSASRARGTRAARRRTSSRPTPRPGCGWRPARRPGRTRWREGKVTASGNRADLSALPPAAPARDDTGVQVHVDRRLSRCVAPERPLGAHSA